ncbi:hypothetical protein LPJ66_012174, partial [Kickxella alabastrina]
MEDIMARISASDSPRTTLFDVLDAEMLAGSPLVRIRSVAVRQCPLPDGRMVNVIVGSSPLESRLVVDSAVTTLSARIYEQVDATFAALVPGAPPITESDTIRVDIERIMQFAHAIELRTPAKHKGGFSWIARSQADKPSADGDAAEWQAVMAQLMDDVAEHLSVLEDETSLCGDAEQRRRTGVALAECVEKLALETVHLQVFSPPFSDDAAQDQRFASKVAALNLAGITLDHLGLTAKTLDGRRDLARICADTGDLLARMDRVKSPAEKLKLIVDAHRRIVDRMQKAEAGLSADSILPVLIFAMVRANPPRFVSNLRFVQRFRTRALMAPQVEYCMTNAVAAVSFVDS